MKSVRRDVTLRLSIVGLVTLWAPPLQAQDPCPSASAVDAEAGWTAYQESDMVAARDRFLAALARCGNDQYARTGLGYVALRAGNTAEASDLFLVVIDMEPNNVDALVGMGLARWRSADLDAVRAYFTTVIELAPDHPTALEYLDRLDGANAGASAPPDPADQAWLDGDTELAFRIYSERLDTDSTDALALLRVALVTGWGEQYDAAIALLDLLIDLHPTHVDARLARARVRAWAGDIPAAQDEVMEVLSVQPDNADALAVFALFQSWSGQLGEALAGYDELLSIAPEHGAARRQQAQTMAWAAQFEQSLAAYEALVARSPDDIDARLGFASALAFSSKYDEAVEQYDEVLARDASHMRALTDRAKTLGWAGRLVESERAAARAVEVDPTSGLAWSSLGQVYRWQERDAAAKEAFEVAARLSPTSPGIRDQLRSVNLALAPLARPNVTSESDSDGNRMLTTALTASWHPTPRLDVRARGYYKQLKQTIGVGLLERTAQGVMVTGTYKLRPGWTLTGGLGGSMTDGLDDPTFLAFNVGIRTPDRSQFVVAVDVSSNGLDETAALAERGVRSSEVLVTGRWTPGPRWLVNANMGLGRFDGTEPNGRRSGYLGASRRIARFFSLGASFRGFSFEKNLDDGYFDPDFYGIAELTGYWLYRPIPWTFLIELAPGVQQVTTNGDPGGALRSNARVAYQIGSGREVSLSFGYSSAGLASFATGESGYSYTAVIFGFNWGF